MEVKSESEVTQSCPTLSNPYLPRTLYAGQEADVKQPTGSKLGKEHDKAAYCHPAYLTYTQSTSCKNAGLNEAQAGIKIAGENINNLRHADDTTLMVKVKKN